MGVVAELDVSDTLGNLDSAFGSVLDARHERRLLEELSGCRRKLAEALAHNASLVVPEVTDGTGAMSRFIADAYANHGPDASRNEAVFRHYFARSAVNWRLPTCG